MKTENKPNMESISRCPWCGQDPLYVDYHDNEWGRETTDERLLFEFLVLESAQAGLSWITILRKREGYRKAYLNFDPKTVAAFGPADIERLMMDESIVRNRLKIETSITNAREFLNIAAEYGSFRNYLLSFFPGGKRIINRWKSMDQIPASTPVSEAISRDMKRRGFRFFGPVVCYAYLQAVGLVDDHLDSCGFKTAE